LEIDRDATQAGTESFAACGRVEAIGGNVTSEFA
jgi:hypothetical protein